jgi:hypothetical protein
VCSSDLDADEMLIESLELDGLFDLPADELIKAMDARNYEPEWIVWIRQTF